MNCGKAFIQKATNQVYCSSQCRNAQQQKRPEYIDRRLWDYYQLRYDDLESALDQQGHKCLICLEAFQETRTGRWVIDHDHSCCESVPTCGRCNRGVICASCNTALGMAGDLPANMDRAAEYLRRKLLPDLSRRTKNCDLCGSEFLPYRSSSKYCSKKCGSEAAKNKKHFPTSLQLKICPGCGLKFKQRHPSQTYCGRDCTNKNWTKQNELARFWTKYRIPEHEAVRLIGEQGGACAICFERFGSTFRKRPHVDHDHSCCERPPTCGACNRGIVCGNCNTLLAKAKDSADVLVRGAAYLRRDDRLVSRHL